MTMYFFCVLLDMAQYNHTIMKKKQKRKRHPKSKSISFRWVKTSKEHPANKFFFNDPLSKFTETHLDGVHWISEIRGARLAFKDNILNINDYG